MIAEGAADGLLDDPEIAGLFNHNPDLVLGRVGAGTMALEDNPPRGVRYLIDAPDTTLGNDLRVLMERGDVYQSSFAFRIARGGDTWEEDPESGLLIRTIIKFSRLFDMSPVTYPAYPSADSGVASLPTSAEDEPDSAPPVERTDDEPAEAARPDGDGEDQQAGDRSALLERKERLRLRIGEPPY
jgi:HK97 family phage prohead protease